MEQALVIGFQTLAGRIAFGAIPAGWRDIGFAYDIFVDAVRHENFQRFALAIAGQRHVVKELTVLAGNELDLRVTNERCKRISFEAETVGRGIGMHRVTHLDFADAGKVDLFLKGEEKWLVGAADAGGDALFLQRLLGGTAAFCIVKCPGFERQAGLGTGDQSFKSALD
ncbi:hypothetical protein D3C80_1504460 [compost metagenome]